MNISPSLKGSILVGASGLLYGVIGFFGVKIMDEGFSVSTMLFWRFMIAFLWIGLLAVFTKRKVAETNKKLLFFLSTMTLAILTYSASSVFYFLASLQTGTGIAMVIFFAYPIFVALLSFLLGQWRFNKPAFFALTALVFGLLLIRGNEAFHLHMSGILLGIVASLAYGIYVFGSQYSVKIIDSSLQTILITLGNAFVFLMIASYTGTFQFPTTTTVWLYVLGIGIIGTALPIQLLLEGLKYISPVKASILSVLEPVMTLLIGMAVLNETLTLGQSCGIFIMILGAILIQFEKTRSELLIKE